MSDIHSTGVPDDTKRFIFAVLRKYGHHIRHLTVLGDLMLSTLAFDVTVIGLRPLAIYNKAVTRPNVRKLLNLQQQQQQHQPHRGTEPSSSKPESDSTQHDYCVTRIIRTVLWSAVTRLHVLPSLGALRCFSILDEAGSIETEGQTTAAAEPSLKKLAFEHSITLRKCAKSEPISLKLKSFATSHSKL
ncbi:hypothetical protein CPC16_008705 [Podila verticillata]|nr:hypothetical protein CPC16_008705 [Podila verticillata]